MHQMFYMAHWFVLWGWLQNSLFVSHLPKQLFTTMWWMNTAWLKCRCCVDLSTMTSVSFLSTMTECSSTTPIYHDRFIFLSHCIPSQHPIMCVTDGCTIGCFFMFHDLFALIKVTQKHNDICMDKSYCCHLTMTHTFSMDHLSHWIHWHHLCHVQQGFDNDTTESKFAIFMRQPHMKIANLLDIYI